jgi:hypothetical protein
MKSDWSNLDYEHRNHTRNTATGKNHGGVFIIITEIYKSSFFFCTNIILPQKNCV